MLRDAPLLSIGLVHNDAVSCLQSYLSMHHAELAVHLAALSSTVR